MQQHRCESILIAVLVVLLGSVPTMGQSETIQSRVSKIGPSDHVQFELQSRLIDAVPGDVIELAAGRYELRHQLSVVTDGLTIRGAGSDKTVLTFKDQVSGSAGLEATGDRLTLEGFAVEDTAGNAIKILGAEGVTCRDVRTEWTGPATEKNGAYGLYPVQCSNVLLDGCISIGASDAGIYVGQSKNVIVRNCIAERNVAGIEIENTIGADVYDNRATNNAGGLLVFDLPGLQVTNGNQIRVYRNNVFDNNHPNFASKGSIVSMVPAGMGVMILATDDVELFDNDIKDHQTSGIAIFSFEITGKKLKDKKYNQYPEGISIHDNRIINSGYAAKGEMSLLLKPVLGKQFPDILWDGIADEAKLKNQPKSRRHLPAIRDNGDIRFANFDFRKLTPQNMLLGRYKVQRELATHFVEREALPKTKLTSMKELTASAGASTDTSASRTVSVYRNAKKRLSEYDLFVGNLSEQKPAEGVVPYDLNTPLFSDHTTKYRFIRVPDGQAIEYRDQGVLQFPAGTVIAKTFSYLHDMRDPSLGERLLETRIEFREEDGWYGFSYLWNDEQTDAELALGGAEMGVEWIHEDGQRMTNAYQVPNANQCISCHQVGDNFVPIGPIASNMNREFEFGHGSENQLSHLMRTGKLTGLSSTDTVHAWPEADSDAPIKDRARTWLHVNCAHCHRPEGTARTSGLDLRIGQSDLAKLGVWKTPVAAGHGTGGHSYDIVPGKPDESILLHRLKSTDPSVTMPSVAKSMVFDEAVSLIHDWIASMQTEPDSQ